MAAMSDHTENRVPVPDPSSLTTDQLRRELGSLKELLLSRIDAVEKTHVTFSESIQRVPTILDREISKVTQLFAEKFHGIETQFAERDVRTASDKQAASVGVAAALQAQKEMAATQNESNTVAVKKSDDATTKLIDSILLSQTANAKAIDDKIMSINSRLDRAEAASLSSRQTHTDTRMNIGSVVGIIGGAVGVLTLLTTVAVSISRPQPTSPLTVNQPAAQGLLSPQK